jgi:4-hydroxy-3-polyprenylbenzoate decarboxylase
MRIVVGITGASGAIYAQEFLRQCEAEKYLIVSKWGKEILREELGITEDNLTRYVKKIFSDDDLSAPLASGTNKFDAFIILPCSVSTLGKIASGVGDTLITRTAQVALKERWKLVLCLRETPLSTLSLEQAARLSQYGATIMPLSPSFYHHPSSLEECINGFIDKLLGVVGVRECKGWCTENLE